MQQDQQLIIRPMVRGLFDVQKLRIQCGNRIVANFKAKLGQEPSKPEEEMDAQGKAILADLRIRYKKITDGVKTFPRQTSFKGDEVISTYAELCLIAQYMSLEKAEDDGFHNLGNILKDFPIYTEFLEKIKGIGPTMAGVILSEFNIHKAKYPSSLIRFCFPAETTIMTPNGAIPIESVQEGQSVYDSTGALTEVKETLCHEYSGDLITLRTIGGLPITTTAEHPFLVCEEDGIPQWKEAQNILVGNQLILPKLTESSSQILYFEGEPRAVGKNTRLGKDGIALTCELAKLLGRFVADGSASTWFHHHNPEGDYPRGVIQIAFAPGEAAIATEYANITNRHICSGRIFQSPACVRLTFGGVTIAKKFQEWFGKGAANKKIPDFIMHAPDPMVRAFLEGYCSGDGHIVKEGKSRGTMMASSASRGLILQLQLLFAKIGFCGAVHYQKRSTTISIIRGREIHQSEHRYILSLPKSAAASLFGSDASFNRAARKIEEKDTYWLLRVKEVERIAATDLTVYNLNTTSHSYIAGNYAVHNCGLDVVHKWTEFAADTIVNEHAPAMKRTYESMLEVLTEIPKTSLIEGPFTKIASQAFEAPIRAIITDVCTTLHAERFPEHLVAFFAANRAHEMVDAALKDDTIFIADLKAVARRVTQHIAVGTAHEFEQNPTLGAGRSRHKDHLVRVKYINKAGQEAERDSITFNPFLKTKLIGVLAKSFLRAGNEEYCKVYYDYRNRLESMAEHATWHRVSGKCTLPELINEMWVKKAVTKGKRVLEEGGEYIYKKPADTSKYREVKLPEGARYVPDTHDRECEIVNAKGQIVAKYVYGKSKGHRHNMAIRYMVKIFLQHLYFAWRPLEGLPVAPTYAEAKLGLIHGQKNEEAA